MRGEFETLHDYCARLTRFRADPGKVRVSFRRCRGLWIASVESRARGPNFAAVHDDPGLALEAVLEMAEDAGLEGLDLSMGWSYEHPMRPGPR